MTKFTLKTCFRALLYTSISLLLLTSCSNENSANKFTATNKNAVHFFALDTYITLDVYGADDEFMLTCQQLVSEYEQKFSRTIEDSETSKINSAEGEAVSISAEMRELISLSIEYSEASNGAFDITIGPVSSLWDFSGENDVPPNNIDVVKALSFVSWRDIILTDSTVQLKPGMSLDFGGIAKGFIADKLRQHIADAGYTSALLNLGGNVHTLGSKPDGSPWNVGIQNPDAFRGETIGKISVVDKTVVSSATYERYFIFEDEFYHHILNSITGYPSNSDISAVTIVADSSAVADALSTSCFVLGSVEAIALIESNAQAEAILILDDGTYLITSGLEGSQFLTLYND